MHIGIASIRQFQCVPTNYVTEIKESYFEICTKKVSCPLAISNCQSVLKYLSLYGKLFIFTWKLYHQIWFHELCICEAGSCMVVRTAMQEIVPPHHIRGVKIWSKQPGKQMEVVCPFLINFTIQTEFKEGIRQYFTMQIWLNLSHSPKQI